MEDNKDGARSWLLHSSAAPVPHSSPSVSTFIDDGTDNTNGYSWSPIVRRKNAPVLSSSKSASGLPSKVLPDPTFPRLGKPGVVVPATKNTRCLLDQDSNKAAGSFAGSIVAGDKTSTVTLSTPLLSSHCVGHKMDPEAATNSYSQSSKVLASTSSPLSAEISANSLNETLVKILASGCGTMSSDPKNYMKCLDDLVSQLSVESPENRLLLNKIRNELQQNYLSNQAFNQQTSRIGPMREVRSGADFHNVVVSHQCAGDPPLLSKSQQPSCNGPSEQVWKRNATFEHAHPPVTDRSESLQGHIISNGATNRVTSDCRTPQNPEQNRHLPSRSGIRRYSISKQDSRRDVEANLFVLNHRSNEESNDRNNNNEGDHKNNCELSVDDLPKYSQLGLSSRNCPGARTQKSARDGGVDYQSSKPLIPKNAEDYAYAPPGLDIHSLRHKSSQLPDTALLLVRPSRSSVTFTRSSCRKACLPCLKGFVRESLPPAVAIFCSTLCVVLIVSWSFQCRMEVAVIDNC